MAVVPAVLLALSAISTAGASFTAERFALAAPAPAATSIPAAEYVTEISGKVAKSDRKKAFLKEVLQHLTGKTYVGELAGSGFDEEYVTPITIGGQNFEVIVDTGSSDTWLAETGFKCSNLTSYPEPESYCAFGSPLFNPNKSSTFKSYPNHNFNISYGDGEFLTGTVGFDTVTVAGLTVTNQEIGVVNKAAWNGDSVTSGLLGLAYPGLTSVYNTSNPLNDSLATSEVYSPYFYTAVEEKKVDPYFSVALNRGSRAAQENSTYDPHLGYIAFGGLPPVNVTNTTSTVKVETYTVSYSQTPQYFFWTVPVDKYTFTNSTKLQTNGTAILDTGTTLNYLPTDVAAAYNKAFDPPATYDDDYGLYFVDCDAKAPAFAVVIGGKSFAIDPRDNNIPAGTDEDGNEVCISGTQDGGPNTPDNILILGDVFLHNVVATFQTAANAVTLTERAKY